MTFKKSSAWKALPALLLGLSLGACVSASYSGPIEVTRFVSETRGSIGQGAIAITFPEEMKNIRVRDAFYNAVAIELAQLGYIIAGEVEPGIQTARLKTSRTHLAPASSRGSVSVGVDTKTGGYGNGLGLGVGINLGGSSAKPNALTELWVRISDENGKSLWEGRASQAVSINSPYADVDASAGALAAGLFQGFPGGNGETVEIAVKELQVQK